MNWRATQAALAERTYEGAQDAAYQAKLELEAAITNRTNELFAEYLASDGSLCDALQETAYGDIRLDDVMDDEAELGRRIKTAILRYLARKAEQDAEKEMQ